MKKKLNLVLLLGILAAFLFYNFAVTEVEVAELSTKEQKIFRELFEQENFLSDISIEGYIVLYVRGEVEGKSFESKYSPDDDPFELSYCGALPSNLKSALKKKHPDISSPSFSISFFNRNKTYRWISIHRWDSDTRIRITVGRSGLQSGTSSSFYELNKIDGKWVCSLISVKMS